MIEELYKVSKFFWHSNDETKWHEIERERNIPSSANFYWRHQSVWNVVVVVVNVVLVVVVVVVVDCSPKRPQSAWRADAVIFNVHSRPSVEREADVMEER